MGTATRVLTRSVSSTTVETLTSTVRGFINDTIAMMAEAGAKRHDASLAVQFDPANYNPTTVPTAYHWVVDDNGHGGLVWVMDDDPSRPFYLRIRPYAHVVSGKFVFSYAFQAGYSVDSTTSGAPLTGSITSTDIMTNPTSSYVTGAWGTVNAYAATQPGFIALVLDGNAWAACGMLVDRLRNFDGTVSTDPVGLVSHGMWNAASSGGVASLTYSRRGLVLPDRPYSESSSDGGWSLLAKNSLTSGITGSEMIVNPLVVPTPKIRTSKHILAIHSADVLVPGTYESPAPGSPTGTFRASQVMCGVGLNASTYLHLATFRWE